MTGERDPFRELAEAEAAFGAAFRTTWLWRFADWFVLRLTLLLEAAKRGR